MSFEQFSANIQLRNSPQFQEELRRTAQTYGDRLRTNPSQLKNSSEFNFYGAFTGVEGRYIMGQKEGLSAMVLRQKKWRWKGQTILMFLVERW